MTIEWLDIYLGEVTEEVSDRFHKANLTEPPRIYGVDRHVGLTGEAKYIGASPDKYKVIRPGMFAYNPMRLNIGSIGYCSEYHSQGLVSPDYEVFRCRSARLLPEYLWILTKTPAWQQWVARAGVGSVRTRIYYQELAKMPLRLPTLDYQRVVCSIVFQFEQQIRLLSEAILKIEQFRRQLFKEMFSPIRRHQIPKAGHSSKFEPEMIELGSLVSAIIDHRGKTPEKLEGSWANSGYVAISAKNVKANQIVSRDTFRYVDETLYRQWMKDPLVSGDIIMTSEAPLGEFLYLPEAIPFCLSQRLFAIRANQGKVISSYLYSWLDSDDGRADMKSRATGTTVQGIRQAELRRVLVPVPPMQDQRAFARVIEPALTRLRGYDEERYRLESALRILRPELASGRITPLEGRHE